VSRKKTLSKIHTHPNDLQRLQERLGYTFNQPALLDLALTHRSRASENNERLEFLGDSVLNCAVADLLYSQYPSLNEGDLSRLRANLVKQQSLFEIAQTIGLSQYLCLGEGERKSGGLRRPSILADTFEAIIGALFIDGGFDAARQLIHSLYLPILAEIDPQTLGKDDKTFLQEYLQAHKLALPEYSVVTTHGAAHLQQFEVVCKVLALGIQAIGHGSSRRAAEQDAAHLALTQLQTGAPQPRRNLLVAQTK
jgi:ribonuclease III